MRTLVFILAICWSLATAAHPAHDADPAASLNDAGLGKVTFPGERGAFRKLTECQPDREVARAAAGADPASDATCRRTVRQPGLGLRAIHRRASSTVAKVASG